MTGQEKQAIDALLGCERPETIGALLGHAAACLRDYYRGSGLLESHRSKAAAQSLVWIVQYIDDLQEQIDDLRAEMLKRGDKNV